MLMNKPGSESVRYGLNVPKIPRRIKAAYNGSCLSIHENSFQPSCAQ